MMVDSVLVHVCCAHCAAYTLEFWQKQGYRAGALWYNPNIHPEEEYYLRLQATEKLLEQIQVPLTVYPSYHPSDYFEAVNGCSSHRCVACFRLRLGKTVEAAQQYGYGAFSSTLLISPHQEHDDILAIGSELGLEHGVTFLYSDLRRRYSDSRVMTKPRGLYRQNYCGCVYSKQERGLSG